MSTTPSNQTPAPMTPQQRRTRSERVALRSASQGIIARLINEMRKDHFGSLILIMCGATLSICLIMRVWDPPFEFHANDVTDRAIVCNTHFSVVSPEARRIAEERIRWNSPHVYMNDPQPLIQLRESLWITVGTLLSAHSYEQLDEKGRQAWEQFLRPRGKEAIPDDVDAKASFEAFVANFKDEKSLDIFNNRLKTAFTEFEIHGLLNALNYGPGQGSQENILVYLKGKSPETAVSFRVGEVLIRDGAGLKANLQRDLPREMQNETFVNQLFNWLYPKLTETLREDKNATAEVQQKAVEAVGDQYIDYVPGQILVEAGKLLGSGEIALLAAEHKASLKKRDDGSRLLRFHAVFLGTLTLLVISWAFIRRLERRRPKSPLAFTALMGGLFLTVLMAQLLQIFSITNVDWIILSLLLFVMAVSITYSWELATVYAVILTLVLSFGNGGGTDFFIILVGVSVSTALQLGRLRSRKKLVLVGVVSGIVAAVLTIAVGLLGNQPWGEVLWFAAGINFLAAFFAGLIMTGLLPFLEAPFGILSDMSLLELGDVSHPLLQSLIRLAPATYGHSMQVGTIAETAAEAIGARGLLTRVGAYFHDIGKIMKPEYYSENQAGRTNIHDTLQPQVSTIVVIAHVKDGVDLARQHRLPQPLIDLIEQHHGTTLVSFFYGRAANKVGKDEPQVEESTFRYPGPKPQSKEAAILMIADSCESACRSMGAAATPGKIENKVRVIIKQKLDDGQFDDSGLTLLELKTIENSVIKSIIAAMHGRIRYPGQVDEEAAVKSDSDALPALPAEPIGEKNATQPVTERSDPVQPVAERSDPMHAPVSTDQRSAS